MEVTVQRMPKWIGALLVGSVVALLLILAMVTILPEAEEVQAPVAKVASEASPAPTRAAVEAAKNVLMAEPKVFDVIFDPGAPVDWTIAVKDDGSDRSGFADYVCVTLREQGALRPNSWVRIVDVRRIKAGQTPQDATLGGMVCATGDRLP